MKKITTIFILFILASILSISSIFGQNTIPEEGLAAISADTMYAQVAYMASDELMGRNTPSPGLDSCAFFIANYFKYCGLKPIENANGYFQDVPLLKTKLAETQKLSLTVNGTETAYEIKKDFVPVHLTANREVTAPVVFVGYGITATEYNYDDYGNIDVNGKIVLVFTNEPQEKDTSSVFKGAKSTDHSKLNNKVMNAIDHGAVGFIYVSNPSRRFRRPPNAWPSLMRNAPKDAIPLTLGEKQENKIVVMRIGKKLSDAIFSVSQLTMKDVHEKIDADLKPQSFELKNVSATLVTNLDSDKFMSQNVVGLLEGSDPELKDEIVVIGGHYDHLGARNDTTIYNGADDNASGTAGVMATAKAFFSCSEKPKRSILFMAFAGEEKGLFGSRYYVGTDPLFPLENTVAMINLDMISRNDTSEVEVYGWSKSEEMKQVFLNANELVNLPHEFKDEKGMRGGSDHMSFGRKDIPYLFFITGLHKDYHKPTDTVEKILPEKMAKVARIAFGCVWQAANMDGRPKFTDDE
ncbi:M28 family peptidase [candidate division KSB1 bacterium]|nr:M28 family peptidase [candidate division KSB1 bacterium]